MPASQSGKQSGIRRAVNHHDGFGVAQDVICILRGDHRIQGDPDEATHCQAKIDLDAADRVFQQHGDAVPFIEAQCGQCTAQCPGAGIHLCKRRPASIANRKNVVAMALDRTRQVVYNVHRLFIRPHLNAARSLLLRAP